MDDWARSLDLGKQTDVIVFDFSKVFDSVPHQWLLAKLNHYGIRGKNLQWLQSFLLDRKQRVVLNGSSSPWSPVISGVPQGTVLGPLLFLLYINDIVDNITSQVRLFADDCILYREINTSADVLALQKDIDSFENWAKSWQMSFNSKKCHSVTVTRKRKQILSEYFLGSAPLLKQDDFTYLGVTIASDLRWNRHVNNVVAKATRTLNFIRRNCFRCSLEARSLAYVSLVRPHLEYSVAAWDPFTASNVGRLEMVQRRAARFVKRDYRRTTSVTGLLDELGWQTLVERRRFSRLSLFYRALHGQAGLGVDRLRLSQGATRASSGGDHFLQLSCRTEVYRNSFFPRTLCDWNSLSASVRSKPSLETFRGALLGDGAAVRCC